MVDFSKIIFGGNVFGWTVDEQQSKQLLSYAFEKGISSIDTSDMYQTWVPGHKGGESETIIGKWLKENPLKRDQVQIITKVGAPLSTDKKGLSKQYIKQAIEDSLQRLNTEYVDAYLSHYPDPACPIEETLRAYEELLNEGKVRHIGASNHTPDELEAAIITAQDKGLPAYEIYQPGYNLADRSNYEENYLALCQKYRLKVITYYSLAAGFLSGKYRSLDEIEHSKRKGMLQKYFTPEGLNILKTLDQMTEKYQATHSELSLSWLLDQPSILAPIASATTLQQIDALAKAASIKLSAEDLELLNQLK